MAALRAAAGIRRVVAFAGALVHALKQLRQIEGPFDPILAQRSALFFDVGQIPQRAFAALRLLVTQRFAFLFDIGKIPLDALAVGFGQFNDHWIQCAEIQDIARLDVLFIWNIVVQIVVATAQQLHQKRARIAHLWVSFEVIPNLPDAR